jgi:hypothetical protein
MIELLQQLSEAGPDVCRKITIGFSPVRYRISDYEFWLNSDELYAAFGCKWPITGSPALAWLRDALEAAIAARGWSLRIESMAGVSYAKVEIPARQDYFSAHAVDVPTALLTAFIAALRQAHTQSTGAGDATLRAAGEGER